MKRRSTSYESLFLTFWRLREGDTISDLFRASIVSPVYKWKFGLLQLGSTQTPGQDNSKHYLQ